jgi:hypothetical protein
VGLLSKWQKINWSGITPQKAEITPQNAKIKLEPFGGVIPAFWGVILLQFNFCLLGSNPTPV